MISSAPFAWRSSGSAMASPPSTVIELPSPGAELAYRTPSEGAIAITSPEDYTAVAERLKTIKAFQKRVREWFDPLKRKANEAHTALCHEERKLLAPSVQDADRHERAMTAFVTEQDRKRREEERRLREEQRRQEEARRLEEAAALERESRATGDEALQQAATSLIEAPLPVMPVVVSTPAPPKVDGVSYRDTYRAEVFNLDALKKASIEIPSFAGLVVPNQSALDGLARSLKTSFDVPGVRLVVEKIAVTRSR